jgi:2-polyprenyl-6-methoxyphenol hydroxylase-like FAD-dependent oxidoreductase
VLISAVPALSICKSLLFYRNYYITAIVSKCLQHSPLSVLAIYFDILAKELLFSSFSHFFSIGFQIRCLPVYPYLYMLLSKKRESAPIVENKQETLPIIISGAGVAGLVLGTTLGKLNIPHIILEKKDENAVEEGADLAFWPSSIKILKELGINSQLWENSYHISKVQMTKISENLKEDIMKIIDMDAVTMETGEKFKLVAREELMKFLGNLNNSKILYSSKILKINEFSDKVEVIYSQNGIEKSIFGSLLLGADGVHSICRQFLGNTEKPRYSGEICIRGICKLSETPPGVRQLFEEKKPNIMSIWYGFGLRSSWGLLSKNKGFWWIKAKAENQEEAEKIISKLPEPLNRLPASASSMYVHPVIDRVASERWCSGRIALVGDAAHPVTPNMGQGLCYI